MREEIFWILLSKKIAGEATAAELEQLHELVTAHPSWKTTLENLQEIWQSRPEQSVQIEKQQKLEEAYLLHISRLNAHGEPGYSKKHTNNTATKIRPFYRRTMYAAVVLLVSVAGGLLWYQYAANPAPPITTRPKSDNEISIASGSRSKIQLPDGSSVWINAGSKLTYGNSFKGSSREVYLNGEAYFDVVKDPKHPFIVHTSGIDIKVLGTAFNVKAYEKEPLIETTLIHGLVEVIKKDEPDAPRVMLKPHEKLVYNKTAALRKPAQLISEKEKKETPPSITIIPLRKNIPDSIIAETSWIYNKLTFEDERFEDLAIKMERWYNVSIVFENESLKNYKISGSFVNESTEEALQELQFLVPFRYTAANRKIRILKK